jgi:hypothetical protein
MVGVFMQNLAEDGLGFPAIFAREALRGLS